MAPLRGFHTCQQPLLRQQAHCGGHWDQLVHLPFCPTSKVTFCAAKPGKLKITLFRLFAAIILHVN